MELTEYNWRDYDFTGSEDTYQKYLSFVFPINSSKRPRKVWVDKNIEYDYDEEDPDPSYDEMLRLAKPRKEAILTKVRLPLPIIERYGRKFAIINFKEITLRMNRPSEHVQEFLNSELAMVSSIGSDGVLITRNKLSQIMIIELIKRYIKIFVECTNCKSIRSDYIKIDRRRILRCFDCYAEKTLPSIDKNVIH